MTITWEEFLDPRKAMKGLRPYGVLSSMSKDDEASVWWGLIFYGAATGSAVGSTLGAGALTSTGEWYLYQNVLRFHPAYAAGSLVLYSPDISFAIGEEIESQSPGSGGQMSNALHYGQGGMMSGGSMPVVTGGTGKYGQVDMSAVLTWAYWGL